MSRKLRVASLIAVAATIISTLFNTNGSGAQAQDKQPEALPGVVIETPFMPAPQTEPLDNLSRPDTGQPAPLAQPSSPTALSLSALVSDQPQGDLSRELSCLAGAIYFEAKGTSLAGQLAVGRVIVARSLSGRFPASYCGVVFQPSQFSFVRGRAMPAINLASRSWREAVAIARIADSGSWRSPVEGALFFHASHVSPGWRLKRVARVDNHIFYR